MNHYELGESKRYAVRQAGSNTGRYTELRDAVLRAELLWKREHRKVVIEQDGNPIIIYAVLFSQEVSRAASA